MLRPRELTFGELMADQWCQMSSVSHVEPAVLQM